MAANVSCGEIIFVPPLIAWTRTDQTLYRKALL